MNELVITFVVILLPGIFAAVICDKITIHGRWTSFKFALYSVVLGVASYGLLQSAAYTIDVIRLLRGTFVDWTHLKIWDSALNSGSDVAGIEVVFAGALAIPVAFLASWSVNHKVFNRLAQFLHSTTKYGDENLYSYYLTAKEIDWVYVRSISENLTYQGRVISHSENDAMQELVLADVSVHRYEDSAHLYDVPTLYMSKPLGTLIIEAVPSELLEKIDEQETATD